MSKLNKIGDIKKVIKDLMDDPYNYARKITIHRLVDILRKLSYHYYNTNEALVPDTVYDLLRNVLEERDPTNDYLKEIGSPISKEKVKLPYFMPSLDKIKPETDAIDKWKKKYKGPYVLSDKLDGVSGLLYRDKNKFKLYTRGNGREGQDISFLIPYVMSKGIKFDKMPYKSAVRGELIISKENFNLIKKDFKNARNSVAGLVNSKNYSVNVAKITEFIAYSVINPNIDQVNQMKTIEEWNIPIVNYSIKKDVNNDMLSEILTNRRKNSKYEIDGIVVIDSSVVHPNTIDNPPYGFAFKQVLMDQVAETIVLDVLWAPSMYGYLKPRVKVDPVQLTGVEINYATAFNAKYVVDNILGPGALIKLVRSGDVIPHIMKVLKPSANGKPKMPDIPYKWNKTGIDIIVKDIHGAHKDTITAKKITRFFQIMGVKYINIGIVTKIIENGYDTIIKILTADPEDFSTIEGLGSVIMNKIYKNIKESQECSVISIYGS